MNHKTIDFSGEDVYIGLDVHKKSWSVTILTDEFEHKTFQQPPRAEALESYLSEHFPGATYHSAYEAGFCGYGHHRQLHNLGIQNMVVNAADVPSSNKDRTSKTDDVDSRKIAKALRGGLLEPIHVFDPDHEELRFLSRLRFSLVKDRRRAKQRIRSLLLYFDIQLPDDLGEESFSRAFVDYIKGYRIMEHDPGDKAIDLLIEEYEHIVEQVKECQRLLKFYVIRSHGRTYELLNTIPGIGPIAACTLIAEIGDMERFPTNRRLASYVGLRPTSHSSGENDRKGRITYRNNPYLRTIVVEAAWMAMRKDSSLLQYYKKHASKEPKRALIKVAHKLLNRVRAVWLKGEPYQLHMP